MSAQLHPIHDNLTAPEWMIICCRPHGACVAINEPLVKELLSKGCYRRGFLDSSFVRHLVKRLRDGSRMDLIHTPLGWRLLYSNAEDATNSGWSDWDLSPRAWRPDFKFDRLHRGYYSAPGIVPRNPTSN